MTDTTTDFFDNVGGGAGAPSAVLKNIGDFVHGEVVEMFKKDFTKFGTDQVELNKDGSKRQQMVIILQTDLRGWQNVVKVPLVDSNDPTKGYKDPSEDDGKRAVYAPQGSNIQFAIGKAIAEKNGKFEVGGTLGVKIENLKDTGKGNPLKEHAAVWTDKPVGSGFFPAETQAPAQPAPQAAQPAPQAAPPVQEAPVATPAPAQAAPAQQDPWAASAPAAAAGDPWATPAASAPAASAPPF